MDNNKIWWTQNIDPWIQDEKYHTVRLFGYLIFLTQKFRKFDEKIENSSVFIDIDYVKNMQFFLNARQYKHSDQNKNTNVVMYNKSLKYYMRNIVT